MILNIIENYEQYCSVHPGFKDAFIFLKREDILEVEADKYVLDGENLFIIISKEQGRTKEAAKLEAHAKYIDIQILLGGEEQIGWKSVNDCKSIEKKYDSEKDIEYFSDSPQTYFTLKPGSFAIFFPDDAHSPMVGNGIIHKAVVKVKI